MPTLILDKIIFRNNDTYLKMYKGSELIAEVEQGGGLDYLTFTALEAGSTVTFASDRTTTDTVSYSTDNGTTWSDGKGVTVTLANVGDSVKYKGTTKQANSRPTMAAVSMTGQLAASGSLMSMMNENPDAITNSRVWNFHSYFMDCLSLKDITNLKIPVTSVTLGDSNYYGDYFQTFMHTGITSIPADLFPRKSNWGYVGVGAFRYMFTNCRKLTTVADTFFPANISYRESSCENMFKGCIRLTSIYIPKTTSILGNAFGSFCEGCRRLASVVIDESDNEPASNSFVNAFAGCISLDDVTNKMQVSSTSHAGFNSYLDGTQRYGSFTKLNDEAFSSGFSGQPSDWTVTEIYKPSEFYIQPSSTITITANNLSQYIWDNYQNYQYKIGTGNWQNFPNPAGSTVSLSDWIAAHPNHLVGLVKASSTTSINFFSWNDSTSRYDSWPGQAATLLGTTADYKIYVRDLGMPINGNMIICNSAGSSQTDDINNIATIIGNGQVPYWAESGRSVSQVSASNIMMTTAAEINLEDRMYIRGDIDPTDTTVDFAFNLGTNKFKIGGDIRSIIVKDDYNTENTQPTGISNFLDIKHVLSSDQYGTDTHLKVLYDHQYVDVEVYPEDYLTFTAEEANSTVTFSRSGTTSQYSTDGGTTWLSGDDVTVTLANIGDSVKYRGKVSTAASTTTAAFTLTGQIAASGKLMTMYDYDEAKQKNPTIAYSFTNYFRGQTALTAAPTIDDLESAPNYFIYYMFYGCTGLTTVQNAINIDEPGAYALQSLFYGCTGLTSAPTLNIKKITSNNTCQAMFRGCTGLTTVSNLFPKLTHLGGTSVFNQLFHSCTNLTSVDFGTHVIDEGSTSFKGCFTSCSSLETVYFYVGQTGSSISYHNWMSSVKSGGTIHTLPRYTLSSGASGLPSTWTQVDDGIFPSWTPDLNYVTVKSYGTTTVKLSRDSHGLMSHMININNGGTWSGWQEMVYGTDYTFEECRIQYADLGINKIDHDSKYADYIATGYSFYAGDNCYIPDGNKAMGFHNTIAMGGVENYKYGLARAFQGSTKLVRVPKDFFTLNGFRAVSYEGEFSRMFSGCSGLIETPDLGSPMLAPYCYSDMFTGCTGLKRVNNLFSTSLAKHCYDSMFNGCSSLTIQPDLPALVLRDYCYQYMFNGCSALREGYLPGCDENNTTAMTSMFNNCTALTKIVTYSSKSHAYVTGNTQNGVIYNLGGADLTGKIPVTWTEEKDYYLTLTADTAATIKFNRTGVKCEYSTDGGTTWTSGDNVTVNLSAGNSVKYRGVMTSGSSSGGFTLTGTVKAGGSVMSLIDRDYNTEVIEHDRAFYMLFSGCTGLSKAPDLPSTMFNDKSYVYSYMFSGCTGLTDIPRLSATTLSDGCYEAMFNNCTGLNNLSGHTLPANYLYKNSYRYMFSNCSGLFHAPAMLATTYSYVSSGYNSACEYMFRGTALYTAPELYFTTMEAKGVCNYMFNNIQSGLLSQVITHFTGTWNNEQTWDWITGNASTGRFYNLGGATSITSGSKGKPSTWSLLTAPDTKLKN